jgi:hypothetical protein
VRTIGIAPALAPSTWHAGQDPSGRVHVELDGPGRDVRVTLVAGWRNDPGTGRLGQAVVAAHSEAVVARMTAWALEGQEAPPLPLAEVPAAEQTATVGDAQRELAVFRRRLAELQAVPVTVEGGPGVRVTVRDGRPATVWAEHRGRADPVLAEALAAGLRAALAAVADQPAHALVRCPALQAVLSTSRQPLPFAL